jgi:hypothetical protein
MTIKYTSIFHYKASKIYPNLDFWFENKPSGNPGVAGRNVEIKLYMNGKYIFPRHTKYPEKDLIMYPTHEYILTPKPCYI